MDIQDDSFFNVYEADTQPVLGAISKNCGFEMKHIRTVNTA